MHLLSWALFTTMMLLLLRELDRFSFVSCEWWNVVFHVIVLHHCFCLFPFTFGAVIFLSPNLCESHKVVTVIVPLYSSIAV